MHCTEYRPFRLLIWTRVMFIIIFKDLILFIIACKALPREQKIENKSEMHTKGSCTYFLNEKCKINLQTYPFCAHGDQS